MFRIVHIGFARVVFCVVALTLSFAAPSVSAAPNPQISEPMVVIAVDATHLGGTCTAGFDINIHSPHEITGHRPCHAGTIISSRVVTLSTAESLHEVYVRLPASSSAFAVDQQPASVKTQIRQLMERKAQALLPLPDTQTAPLTSCGNSSVAWVYWYPDRFNEYYATEGYFRDANPNCNEVVVEQATITVYDTYDAGGYVWDHDQYASGWFSICDASGNCGTPVLNPGKYINDVDQTHTAGYYYENWIIYPGIGEYHDDIGPLN